MNNFSKQTDMQEYICIAKITKPFGLKGEVCVLPYSDDINQLLGYKEYFYSNNKIDYSKITYHSHKWSGKFLIIKFNEINDRNDIELFRNVELCVKKEQLPILQEDEYYNYQLVDCHVTFNGANFGKVIDIKNFGTCDLFEICHKKRIYYIPFLNEYVKKIDLNNKNIFFQKVEEYIH